jgi:formylglycine-generating enzyme required for sulfatase activity
VVPASRAFLAIFVASAFAGTLVAGCELLVGIPPVTLNEGSADATWTAPDGGSFVAIDAGPCGRVLPDGALRAGPDMVKIDSNFGSYCIDTTEVTVGDFNAFVLGAPPTLSGTAGSTRPDAPGGCAYVGDLPCRGDASPTSQRPPLVMQGDLTLPITQVIWCDAWAYCRWAGKRMCGAIGDGGPAQGVPASQSEWYFACTNGALNTPFPYGDSYDPTACNSEGTGPVPVGSMPRCHGTVPPFDQIYDMTGNAFEFVDDNESADLCLGVGPKGGSWQDGVQASCAGSPGGFNGCCSAVTPSGFRCCADP